MFLTSKNYLNNLVEVHLGTICAQLFFFLIWPVTFDKKIFKVFNICKNLSPLTAMLLDFNKLYTFIQGPFVPLYQ